MQVDPLSSKYIKFVRAVFEHTGHDAFPVRRIGSGTIVVCEGEFYVLTARHVLTNQGADPTEILVSFPESGEMYWPTTACVHLEAAIGFEDDNAYSDIAVYKLHSTQDIRSFITDNDFLPFPVEKHFSKGDLLYAFGFPDQECGMSTDDNRHLITATAFEGWYEGQTVYRALHVFASSVLLQSQNGMSGGPVTYLDVTRQGRHLLAGLILQGGDQRLHFVDATMVRSALSYALSSLRQIENDVA